MQWDATGGAGFSRATPWLPLASDYTSGNVAALETDARSILALYRALIALRKKSPQLAKGAYQPIAAEGDLLLYRREDDGGALVVALNLGTKSVSIASGAIGSGHEILLSTFLDRSGEPVEETLELRANEGVILGVAAHAP
jgi:alpha-glucosidase